VYQAQRCTKLVHPDRIEILVSLHPRLVCRHSDQWKSPGQIQSVGGANRAAWVRRSSEFAAFLTLWLEGVGYQRSEFDRHLQLTTQDDKFAPIFHHKVMAR